MAYKLVWSPEAIEDIEHIVAFIHRDSPRYASAVTSKLIENAELSALHPKMGRSVPEIQDENIRERFVYSYRVIYQVCSDRIRVVAVLHGSRLITPFVPRIVARHDT